MNDAVQMQKGLRKFFLYLTLSAFLGIFCNFLVQKTVQDMWSGFDAQLKQYGLQASQPHIVFSNSGWPVVGARLAMATFSKKHKCHALKVDLERIFIPIPLLEIFIQQIKLGAVEVRKMRVHVKPDEDCDKKPDEEQGPLAEVAEEPPPAVPAPFELDPLEPVWFGQLAKWFESAKAGLNFPISRLNIEEVELAASDNRGKSLKAKGAASLEFGGAAILRVVLNPLEIKKNEKSITTGFTAHVSASPEEVEVVADWSYYEGHFTAHIRHNAAQETQIQLKTLDLPVSVVNKWFDNKWNLQFLWFNCQLDLNTPKARWAAAPWKISGCTISGPHGEIKVSDSEISSLQKPSSVLVRIFNLNLEKIIKGRDHVLLAGIFKGFGILQGQARFTPGKTEGRFELNDAQVVFSRNNRRKLQVIDSMKFDVDYQNGVYSAVLNSAKVRDGEFNGLIIFDYNKRLRRTNGKISVGKISFAPEIEQLMFDGEFTPFTLVGDVSLDETSHLDTAKVSLSFKSYEGKGLSAQAGMIIAEWKDKLVNIAGSLSRMKISPVGDFKGVFSSMLDEGINRDVMAANQVILQGQVDRAQFKISRLSASTANGRMEALGEVTGGDGTGTWKWYFADKNYEWKWWCKNRELYFVPQTDAMREWLKINDHFLDENRAIRLDEKDL